MSLGNTLSWAAIVFCLGVLTAVDPLLSQAIGARDGPAVTKALLRALLLALVLSLPAMVLLMPAATWLELLGQQQVVVKNLESNYRKVSNVSGATIMGDGRVALILDVGALVRLSRH